MSKIKKLTPQQQRELPEWHERYFQMGASTAPIDKRELEATITDFYRRIGKNQPVFIHCDSPMTSMLMLNVLKKGSSLRSSLGSSLRSSLESSLGSSLESSLRSSLESSLGSSLWSSLESSLGFSLESSLWSSLESSLRSSLRSSLGSKNLFEGEYFYGSINACWISFYQFCEHIGVAYAPKDAELLDAWEKLALHSFNWWPKNGICVCSAKPTAIHWDNAKRIHNPNGKMAIEFADGWGVYAVNGVRLPEKYGEKSTKDWESKWLLEEKNAELRMTLIKNIGYDKICHDLEAKSLDKWREYELLNIQDADVEPIRLLKMTCPTTGKIHVHRVPPDVMFAREAITQVNRGVDPERFIHEC